MKRNVSIAICGLIILVFVFYSLRTVPILPEEDCLILKGTVVDIYEGGVKDVVLRLDGYNKSFYINRGLERGLDLKQLKKELTGREILLKYPDHWTPLDLNSSSVHISKIEYKGNTIFTELD